MSRRLTLASCLLVAGAAFAQDAAPTAADLLARSIEYHGGRAALEALPDLEMRGTYEGSGRMAGRRADMVRRERGDGAYRTETTMEFRGRKFTPVEFYDGEIRKRRSRSNWDDLPLVEAEEARAHRLAFLLAIDPAKARVEDGGVEADAAVWRMTVPDGRDDAQLYFAKDDARLVALDYPGTTAAGMGTQEQVRRKLVFRDYRDVDGLKLAFDVEELRDGTLQGRARYDTMIVLDSFDPSWLQVPDPTRRFIPSEELAF